VSSSAEPQHAESPCLKNARVKKDADGYYYLIVQVRGGNSAMINLTAMNPSLDERIKNEIHSAERKNDLVREVLDTWIAEQDSSLVEVEQPRGSDNFFEDVAASVIDD